MAVMCQNSPCREPSGHKDHSWERIHTPSDGNSHNLSLCFARLRFQRLKKLGRLLRKRGVAVFRSERLRLTGVAGSVGFILALRQN